MQVVASVIFAGQGGMLPRGAQIVSNACRAAGLKAGWPLAEIASQALIRQSLALILLLLVLNAR